MERKTYAGVMAMGVILLLAGVAVLIVGAIGGGGTPTTPEEVTQQAMKITAAAANIGSGLMIMALGVLLMAIAGIGNDINIYVSATVKPIKPKPEPTTIYKSGI